MITDQEVIQASSRLVPKKRIDLGFPKQKEFIEDNARLKALFCTRRAAKSYTGGISLVDTALQNDECNVLYLGLTRLSAKGIIWKDILKKINKKENLGMVFNGTELTATTKNGSIIYVTGVDADEDEMHKLLGKKWKLVIIDEAQSYGIDLRTLIYGVLGPSVIDQGGTICMMGTAGNLTTGLFYDVTNGMEPGWKLFQHTAYDNPFIAKQWTEEIEKIKLTRPLFMLTALFKQWYLNLWVIDEEAKVYKYDETRNSINNLPVGLDDWHYVLGLDLAHSPDSTAFVVGAYINNHPVLYLVKSYKETKMDITDVATYIKKLEKTYPFEVKVVDGANKQAVAELNNRHQLNLIPADKIGKVDFIKLMNDDFVQQRIMLLPDTKDLKTEYSKLVWETDINGKVEEPRKENPVIHNDLCDGALYLWRYCYNYFKSFIKEKDKIDYQKQESWEPVHMSKLSFEIQRAQTKNELDLDPPDEMEDFDKAFFDPI